MRTVLTIPELAVTTRGVPAPVVEEALRLLPRLLAERATSTTADLSDVDGPALQVGLDVTPRELAARIATVVASQLASTQDEGR